MKCENKSGYDYPSYINRTLENCARGGAYFPVIQSYGRIGIPETYQELCVRVMESSVVEHKK
jgi:hypothetical protein